jgi:hypothetical protein
MMHMRELFNRLDSRDQASADNDIKTLMSE